MTRDTGGDIRRQSRSATIDLPQPAVGVSGWEPNASPYEGYVGRFVTKLNKNSSLKPYLFTAKLQADVRMSLE